MSDGGVTDRFELELGWSGEAVRTVVEELLRRGIEAKELRKDQDFEQPLRVFAKLGLDVIQRRQDGRQVRNVVRNDDAGNVLAELAIDSLAFNFKGQQAHHKEVEIEAKSEDGASILGSLTANLQNLFPSDLVPWDHGKLATGLAVERLADSGELKVLLDENNQIRPEAYSRIDSYLRARDL